MFAPVPPRPLRPGTLPVCRFGMVGPLRPTAGTRLTDSQMVNHFPNHYELTRKDLMVKVRACACVLKARRAAALSARLTRPSARSARAYERRVPTRI